MLSLILAHGREIVAARELLVYLPEGERAGRGQPSSAQATPRRARCRVHGSLAGEVLLSGRPKRVGAGADPASARAADAGRQRRDSGAAGLPGEPLGVLAGIDRADGRAFAEEDEQLLMSVAASAATAVATARSVAAARLRLSLEAAEQARARWARELHDETLQGLTGARMVLSAGLARDDLGALRAAAETADEHLAEEMRSCAT